MTEYYFRNRFGHSAHYALIMAMGLLALFSTGYYKDTFIVITIIMIGIVFTSACFGFIGRKMDIRVRE